jgi:cysteinyl-tRNA synthetase
VRGDWPSRSPSALVAHRPRKSRTTSSTIVYQLQRINLAAIAQTKFDLVIADYSRDGSDEKKFTPEQIDDLKESLGDPKTVLSYMSIGEVEDYHWYWQRSWDSNTNGRPDADTPTWLGHSKPNRPGNYKVRY